MINDWITRVIDKINDALIAVIKGGVAYENPPDAWKVLSEGQRWSVALNYTSNLAAGASYTSSSITAQDSGGNNYTELRIFAVNAGASSVTVKVQGSVDNSTWYDIPNQSIDVTSTGTGKFDIYTPYIRIVETNNDTANAQTTNLVYAVLL